MKAKYIFAASLLAAGAAFADTTTVDTDYVLGVMPVSVGNETIIAIPWVESGGGIDGVAVTNLIKTANLAVGDTLYWYNPSVDGGTYYSWQVAETGGVKYWRSVAVATDSLIVDAGADNASLKRGEAVFLKRAANSADTVYVVGQYANAAANALTTTIAAKKGTNAPSYTLIAPPYAEKLGEVTGYVDLNNSAIDWGSPAKDDAIIVGIKYVEFGGKQIGVQDKYVWNSGWGKYTGNSFTKDAKVPVGKGLWYVSYRASAGTVIWNKAAE